MKPQTKLMEVVMLPTDEATRIVRLNEEFTFYAKGYAPKDMKDLFYYHLYIVSDVEPKNEDWVMMKANGFWPVQVYDLENGYFGIRNDPGSVHISNCKKIEATTDMDLYFVIEGEKEFPHHPIPQIPQSFIEAYVKSEGRISEVLVEMESEESPAWSGMWKEWVKTNPDNTIIIHPSKTYTREELIYWVNSAAQKVIHNLGYQTGKAQDATGIMPHIDKWIKDSL